MGEAGSPTAADPIAPEVTMATAMGTSGEVARASQDTALVLPSLHRPASPSAPLGIVISVWMMMCCNNSMPLIGC